MCGHVGIAGDMTAAGMKAFRTLLLWDSVRGEDGTGVALVPFGKDSRTTDNTRILKMPVASPMFLTNSDVKTELNKVSWGVAIGHNRAATVGRHSYENTHPFLCKNVVGAHNGTVDAANRRDLPGIKGTWGTDSETILRSFSGSSAKEAVESMTSCYRGAWAFVWYDYRDNSINFLRNSHRPLYYAFDKDKDQLFWASEAGMLRGALEHAKVDVETRKNSSTWVIRQLPEDTHLSWTVPSHGQRFGEVERTKVSGKKPTTSTTTTRGGFTRSNNNRSYGTTYNPKTGSTTYTPSKFTPQNSLSPATFDLVLYKQDLSDDDVFKLFKKGDSHCLWCHEPVSKEEIQTEKAIALTPHAIVCPNCREKAELAYTIKHVKENS